MTVFERECFDYLLNDKTPQLLAQWLYEYNDPIIVCGKCSRQSGGLSTRCANCGNTNPSLLIISYLGEPALISRGLKHGDKK